MMVHDRDGMVIEVGSRVRVVEAQWHKELIGTYFIVTGFGKDNLGETAVLGSPADGRMLPIGVPCSGFDPYHLIVLPPDEKSTGPAIQFETVKETTR